MVRINFALMLYAIKPDLMPMTYVSETGTRKLVSGTYVMGIRKIDLD